MATLFDGISQRLDFKREEAGSSSDNSSDDYTSRIRSPKIASPRIRSPRYGSPSSACRTPRAQRHRSRSRTMGSPSQCVSPIPYASWKKLRLCDSPSTPKVRTPSIVFTRTHAMVSKWPPTPYLPHATWISTSTKQTHLVCVFPSSRACSPSHPNLSPQLRYAALRKHCVLVPPLPLTASRHHLSMWTPSPLQQSAGTASCSGGATVGVMMMRIMDAGKWGTDIYFFFLNTTPVFLLLSLRWEACLVKL